MRCVQRRACPRPLHLNLSQRPDSANQLPKGDVEYFSKELRRLDVEFIFVQAKTSSHFSGSEMGTFITGVRQFFESSPPLGVNQSVLSLHDLKEYIYDRSIDMDQTPTCRLYFVTTGTWQDDPALLARINQGTADLEATGLFGHVEIIPFDASELKLLYRQLNQKFTREVSFEKHTILPEISGVQEAYIGILPCLEYLSLICDEEGNLNRRLFYDNVRDFQGHNAVNQEIEATICDGDRNDRFALLNNGVTIVARDSNKVGAKFRLRDYQIVNGCQTSHILHHNRSRLSERVFIPVKLIVTGDAEVTNQIIQGTNRQTEVKIEAFESLAPFQKSLEELYLVLGQKRSVPIYYERRSKQYDQLDVRRDHIVTLPIQIQCFVAMFLNEPHSTHRYYGELLNSYRSRLFSDAHHGMPYYVAGVAIKVVERFFSKGYIPSILRPFKHQLLMVFRLMNEPFSLPRLDNPRIEKYSQALLDILDNEDVCVDAFRAATEIVRDCEAKLPAVRDPLERTRFFTEVLVEAVASGEGGSTASATATRLAGVVNRFSDTQGYGFIDGEDGERYFVHYSRIQGQGFRSLRADQLVEFTPLHSARGPQAIDVEGN